MWTFYFYSDIDECTTGAAACDANAICTDTAGSYECVCRSGYSGDGFSCTSKFWFSVLYVCVELIAIMWYWLAFFVVMIFYKPSLSRFRLILLLRAIIRR